MTSRESAAPQRPPTGSPGAGARPALARILLAALLVVLVLVGLRGGIAGRGWRGPYRYDGIAIGAGLEVILAGLLVAVAVRGRRAPDDFLAARLRGVLRAVLLAALVAVPAALLLSAPLRGHQPPVRQLPGHPQPTARPLPTHRPQPPAGFHVPAADLLYALLAIAVIAGIAGCILLLRRHPAGQTGPPDADASLADGEPERAGLRQAVTSGRRALAGLDDTRAAIIACYLAMERSLAAAGASRSAADTPDEFLARAAEAGLVHSAAAGQLTGLFYEARFSSHELTRAQRTAAEDALRRLATDLGGHP
jgi:Domain of unknown function (DUF4129)